MYQFSLIMLMFDAVRSDHPNVVFTSMEEIMTLLIEESDEISMELLQPLLDSLRKENQIYCTDCSPISSKLGEKGLKECASNVRPCLLEALKSKSMNLDDYAEIVAAICNEVPEGEQMTENKNVTNAVYPVKVAFPSAAVICETLLEDGTPSDIKGASSKKVKKKESRENKDAHLGVLVPEGDVLQSQDKRNRSCKGTACNKRKPSQRSRKSGSVQKGDVHTTSGLNIDSKKRHFTKNYGEEVVGTRIRVWWPLDKVFYEGAISTFDPVKKKHEILNDDGVIENLNLSKERWEIVEDNPSDKKHEADLQCFAISSVPSTKKKAKGTSSTKKESGVSSSKRLFFCCCTLFLAVLLSELNGLRVLTSKLSIFRSKRNAQKSDIESLDIPIQHKTNDAIDVGCETSMGEKEVVDKEDNYITLKQRSKTCQVTLESSSKLEDHPSDKSFWMQYVQKHEAAPQSNDVSSVPSAKKKAKRTSSTKKESGSFWMQYVQKHEAAPQSNDVSSVPFSIFKSKRNVQQSDILSLDLPIPDKMNDGADKHESDLQSNDVSSVPSMKKKAKRTSTKREPGISSSKRLKRNAQKGDIESWDVPTPNKMKDAYDVGCEMSSGKKDLVDKQDNMIR
ncbi:sister chromatid cohesion protein PDS5 homolog D-like [Lycium barbarum]|uniref:sister chromatid cohesion protein PDS5 homolog D-like n=1 Tax=Lycium barbarum TaxID=112863 RepID=UPI00293F04C5|nr:sister chromatid cohesion protein PDS5 homolog D-like [Lycium barbarum]